jgi:PIN domain nuclease of toxin-antitoxin system
MIYLDTHVLLWLNAGLLDRFTARGRRLLEQNDLLISPCVKLELHYLFEIGRTTVPAIRIVDDLEAQIGLSICDLPFGVVVNRALALDWTRDPFDRLICAQALCRGIPLLTKDKTIRRRVKLAVW